MSQLNNGLVDCEQHRYRPCCNSHTPASKLAQSYQHLHYSLFWKGVVCRLEQGGLSHPWSQTPKTSLMISFIKECIIPKQAPEYVFLEEYFSILFPEVNFVQII